MSSMQSKKQAWISKVSPNQPSALHKRIAASHSTESEFFDSLSSPQALYSQEELRTIDYYVSFVQCSLHDKWDHPISDYDSSVELPFFDLWTPLVVPCKNLLCSTLDQHPFTEAALNTLTTQLICRLVDVSSRILWAEFVKLRKPHTFLINPIPAPSASIPRFLYQEFIFGLRQDRLTLFLDKYPVFRVFLGIVLRNWHESSSELLVRLLTDHNAICDFFNIPYSSRVTSIESCNSDCHRGGRTVQIIHYTSLQDCSHCHTYKVVYKPKPLYLEFQYYSLLAYINSLSSNDRFAILKVLPFEGYGYVEYISREEQSATSSLSEFYYNVGRLSSVFHLFGCTDLHHENLIASFNQLILVDAETCFDPPHPNSSLASNYPTSPHTDLEKELYRSPLTSGMFPYWIHYGSHSQAIDLSALGITPLSTLFGEKEGWKYINSDLMRSATIFSSTSLPSCLPCKRATGLGNPSLDYVDDIVNGFLDQSQILIDNRDILTSADGPLLHFRTLYRRCILRATQTYYSLQRQQLSQRALSSFFEQSLVLEQLARPFLHGDAPYETWDVFKTEFRQMLSLDIPVFEHMISDGSFNTIGSSNLLFPSDSFTDLVERYISFDMSKAKFHSELIRSSFEASILHLPVPPSRQKLLPTELDSSRSKFFNTIQKARSVSTFVVKHLVNHAYSDSKGRIQWLGFNQHSSGVYSYYPLTTSLYSGIAAVPILISSFDLDRSESLQLSDSDRATILNIQISTTSTLNYMSRHADRSAIIRWWRDLPPGLNGCGGVLLALSLLGEPCPDDILLPEVFNLIASKPILSLANGLMGLIGPLLNIASPLAIDLSLQLGRHFASTLQPTLTNSSSLSPGLGSGLSGLAVVYSRLYCLTDQNLFLEQARFWLKHERSLLHESFRHQRSSDICLGSLPDGTRPNASRCPDLFNGLSGLILSRLLFRGTPIWDEECLTEIALYIQLLLDHSDSVDGLNLAYGALGPISVLDLTLRFDLELNHSLSLRIKSFLDDQWSVLVNSLLSPCPRFYPHRPLSTFPIGFFNGITGLGIYSQTLSSSRDVFDLLLTGGLLRPMP